MILVTATFIVAGILCPWLAVLVMRDLAIGQRS